MEKFTKEKIRHIASLLDRFDLDARFMIGLLNKDWNETQRMLYATPFQGGEYYVVPMRANPAYCFGLTATTTANDDGIVVTTEMDHEDTKFPHDVIPIDLSTVTAIQIRGLDYKDKPLSVFVTCSRKWEEKLLKKLMKMRPVTNPRRPDVNWDIINPTYAL